MYPCLAPLTGKFNAGDQRYFFVISGNLLVGINAIVVSDGQNINVSLTGEIHKLAWAK